MGDVVRIPGLMTVLELDPSHVLTAAVDQDLEEVLILGWKKDEHYPGEFYMAASDADLAKALMLILRAQRHIMKALP